MDKLTMGILDLYQKRGSLAIAQLSAILDSDWITVSKPINYLRKLEFLKVDPNHPEAKNSTPTSSVSAHIPLVITYEGIVALEEAKKISNSKKIEWIRYGITTAIALAGFIKSFFF